ncbi:hypothetical protein VPHF86_0273 [Vibrio phage F86]
MTKFWQGVLAIVGTILIPLSISSLSVATSYGGMQEALVVLQDQGATTIELNTKIVQEIGDIKLTNATQAQQLISLEGQQAAIGHKQDQLLASYGKLETSVESLRVTTTAADVSLRANIATLHESQRELGIKIDARNAKDGEFAADLARVNTRLDAVNEDRFTSSEADMLKAQIEKLDARVEKLSDQQ